MGDWTVLSTKLDGGELADVDDVVDALAECLLAQPPDPTATSAAVKALTVAKSDLSVRSTALALAYVAPCDNIEAVEHLERAFEARRQDAFLAPSLLGSIVVLGLRNETARAGAVRYILRLKSDEYRPLLVAGAKGIGLLYARRNDTALRAKLFTLVDNPDRSVQSEARQQVALMMLADALQTVGQEHFIESLVAARNAFQRAEGSEEVRPDSTLFRLLLDAVLTFNDLELDRAGAVWRIGQLTPQLREVGVLQINRSPAAMRIAERCEAVASALEKATKEAAGSSGWTNFDKSLLTLALCYKDVRFQVSAIPGYEGAALAISEFAGRVLSPRLGPILAQKVGFQSFAGVVRHHEDAGEHPDVLDALRVLESAAQEAERAGDGGISGELSGKIKALSAKAGCTPEELIGLFRLNISTHDGDGLTETVEIQSASPNYRGKRMSRPTIGIIVALPCEFDAVRLMIVNEERFQAKRPGGGREYILGEIQSVRGGIHRVVFAQAMDMGNTSAGTRATKMLMDFDELDHIIMCGIAGGVPNPQDSQEHVRLGDIVVSNRNGVIQYDFGKQKGDEFEERGAPRPPSAELLEGVQLLEQDRLAGLRPWDEHLHNALARRSLEMPDSATEVMLDEKGELVEHPVVSGTRPRVFHAAIASANRVQGDFRKRDDLRDRYKVKAVEMEGSGIADALWESGKGYLVVRGICDYCDNRTKSDQTDTWKPYAAMAAAAYVRALVEMMPGA